MRRLHVRIFFSLLGAIALAMVVTALVSHLLIGRQGRHDLEERLTSEAHALAQVFPRAAQPAELDQALQQHGARFNVDLALYDDAALVARAGAPLPAPRSEETAAHWLAGRGRGPALAVPVDGQRWLVVRPHQVAPPGFMLRLVIVLVSFAVVLIAMSWNLSRRITRRLEQLQGAVEKFGRGELAARAENVGHDEVAALAQSFNQTAAQVQRLVESQQRVLASASHELRSPLTRLRLALELLAEARDPVRTRQLCDDAARDLAELDEQVEDVLLASRLQSGTVRPAADSVDLAALVRSEAARSGAQATVDAVVLPGSESMLRRLLRNLLDNARRYGGGSAIEVRLTATAEGAEIVVSDRGPGVPIAESEKIFEPFYRPAHHSEGEHGGVGLGLALVRQIAAHHNGTASYRPRDGGGSEFVVQLRAAGAVLAAEVHDGLDAPCIGKR